ncbi:cryptochrome circadian regulator 4 isoform X3 [Onychostoma macrolepis]|uniref:cryptochrome circadian regulator 4 isoform X3 n=1 Tax=Onychostoma macrolepis TaxID=369639 RepID=UPI002729B5F3|nr:cryptochrome circadian regulator 4 isoform X3 [Onychostoma macrolepis]
MLPEAVWRLKCSDRDSVVMSHRTIHLFRKGLRLHDNPTLLGALASSAALFPVYVLDHMFLEGAMRLGPLRWRFILQSLEDLDARLRALGSRLYVLRGSTAAVLRDLVTRWSVTQISYDTEVEPYYARMEQEIQALAQERGLQTYTHVSHTLYDLKRRCSTPAEPDPEQTYGVPSLADLGLENESEVLWPGGETHALQRLHKHFQSQGWVANFSKARTVPNSLLPSTTGLSPYLSLGCLSVRTFYHRLSSVYAQSKNHSLPPVSLQGQVLWREFFYTVASATPNFTKMQGNPICLQIDWYHDPEALEKWRTAQTGFPWIDAIMTQLRQEGWIHHLARHAVACFLTRGDLWISWEEGMKVFEEILLDADYSMNAGNWMWLSASAFFHKYTRIFCPVRFGRRTDPQGQYLRKYLPVLKNFPSQYIYEPWKAPEDVQLSAGCIIGKDYPHPMVCHIEASQRNLGLMRQVRIEQQNTAELTRDVADDPMEVGLKRELHEEEELLEGAEQHSKSKRFSGDADHKSQKLYC